MLSNNIRQAAQNRYFIFIIGFLLIARCICTVFLPLTDPTEGRYATISKQMLTSGNWLTPHVWIAGELIPFEGKPPLFFWCDAAAMKLFGANEFAARLPNVIFLTLTLAFMWVILRSYQDTQTAWRAVFMCVSSVVLFVCSGLVIVDILLAAAVSCSLLAYYAFLIESNPKIRKLWSLIIFIMLAAGFMTKGPVAILLFGMPVFVWTAINRDWVKLKEHCWLSGGLIFSILTVPWFILSEMKHPGFCRYFFINENFLRFVVHNYGDKYGSGHDYPRGTAILMMIGAACPWSIAAIFLVIQKRKKIAIKSLIFDKETSLLIIAVLTTTLFWALARRPLITYMFPMVVIFTAWLAIYIKKISHIEHKQYPLFSSHAVVLCLITVIAISVSISSVSRNKSAKEIINISENLLASKGKIYFLESTPYSAYFYAYDCVIIHKQIPIEESFKVEIEQKYIDYDILYVINDKCFNRLSEYDRKNICVLQKYGRYVIFQMIAQFKNPLKSDNIKVAVPEKERSNLDRGI